MRTFRWRLDDPTTTYLTMMYVDRLTFQRSTLPDGVRWSRRSGRPGRCRGPGVQAAGDPGVLVVEVRPVPGSQRGRHVRRREVRVLAGDLHPADVHQGHRGSARSCTRTLTSGGVTTSRSGTGATSVSTSASRRTRSGCGTSTTAPTSTSGTRTTSPSYAAVFKYPLYDMGPGHEFDGAGVYFKGSGSCTHCEQALGRAAFFSALREIQRDVRGRQPLDDRARATGSRRTGIDLTSFWRTGSSIPGSRRTPTSTPPPSDRPGDSGGRRSQQGKYLVPAARLPSGEATWLVN